MKVIKWLSLVTVFGSFLFLPIWATIAQTSEVPITYTGDTDKSVKRRIEWIEGAKKEGEVNWWGVIRPNEAKAVEAEFNKVYPFLKISYWRGRSDEVGTKLEAEFTSGRLTVDVCSGGGPSNFPRWRKMGMLEQFINIVPGMEKLDKRLYSRNGDWIMNYHTVAMPQYNTSLVSRAEAPKSWEDLLDPKWKGQIGLPADIKGWSAMAVGEGDAWGVERTENFLKQLVKAQDIIWARSNTAAHSLLIAGEFKVLGYGYLRHALSSQKKGAPVEWVRANPVVVHGPQTLLPKNAPHPNSARLFLEWLLSPQGFKIFEKITASGIGYDGSGTETSRLLEGLDKIARTEDSVMKELDLGLKERFNKVLGIK